MGYDCKPFGAMRVYESEAWRHYLWGKYGSSLVDRQRSWVIPWAFDPDEWPLGAGGDYVSFLGRLMPDKGFVAIYEMAKLMPGIQFRVAGKGPPPLRAPPPSNVEFVGPIYGRDRATFLGGARAHLCPTEFVEPFCGSAVEAMLCGTPVISTSWGGFTETIVDGVNGYRCASVAEMVAAIGMSVGLNRRVVRASTLCFSLDAAVEKWRRVLEFLAD